MNELDIALKPLIMWQETSGKDRTAKWWAEWYAAFDKALELKNLTRNLPY